MYKSVMQTYCSKENYSCPICAYTGKTTEKYKIDSSSILGCPECDFLFLYPQPSVAELSEIYGETTYFNNQNFFSGENKYLYGYADYFADYKYKKKVSKKIATTCMKHVRTNFPDNDESEYRLLEVGCGPGLFLEEAQKVGFTASGFEINSAIISKIQPDISNLIENINFSQELNPVNEKYHCIVFLDVIEHLYNPVNVINNISNYLKPGGIVVILTIDSGGLGSKILGKRLEDFRRIREHLFFFNKKNISIFLNNNGFEILNIEKCRHTFKLDELLNRTFLGFPKSRKFIVKIINHLSFFHKISLNINTRSKMLMYARKERQTEN